MCLQHKLLNLQQTQLLSDQYSEMQLPAIRLYIMQKRKI
jgi:hypothetical protein